MLRQITRTRCEHAVAELLPQQRNFFSVSGGGARDVMENGIAARKLTVSELGSWYIKQARRADARRLQLKFSQCRQLFRIAHQNFRKVFAVFENRQRARNSLLAAQHRRVSVRA